MKYSTRLLGAFAALLLHGRLIAELPTGAVFDPQKGVVVSGAIVMLVNFQAQSIKRDAYIEQYIAELEDPDTPTRAFAAWALQNFQSQLSLEALLKAAEREQNQMVLTQIDSAIEIGEMLNGLGNPKVRPSIAEIRSTIYSYRSDYAKNGYPGILLRKFEVLPKESKEMFILSLCDHYDPALVPFLFDAKKWFDKREIQEVINSTILSWSGFDLSSSDTAKVKEEIQRRDAMNAKKIYERYALYWRTHGFGAAVSDQDLAMSLLYGERKNSGKNIRGMALRMVELLSAEKVLIENGKP